MPNIIVTDLRGGRNGIDSPLELPDNQCVDALNVDWSDGPLGRKRPGAVPVATTGGTAFTDPIMSMFRHVPTGDETLAEMWAVDAAGLVKRLAGGTAWANVSLDDAISANYQDVAFATLNKKLFMGYNSAVDRLHVYDPVLALVRRVGLAQPAAPAVANQGAGTYAATLRYYRVRYVDYDGTTIQRRSEPSASVSITPSGAGASVRVTKPAGLSEHETHWEIEVSTDGDVFYVLRGVAEGNALTVATTTYDDTALVATYTDLETSEEIGLFVPPTSFKFLSTDGNRLLGGGSWESQKTSRIWFTPVLGSLDHGDDERIPSTDVQKNWIDLNEKDGGALTGLSLPINGVIYAFKYRQTWKNIPTGDGDAPYLPRKMSEAIGCIYFKTIVMAEDAVGNPVVGFLSHKGPYRVGPQGIAHIGRDCEDIWFGANNYPSSVNLAASTMVAWGLYHSDLHQIWWYLALTVTGVASYDSPELKIMVDVRQQVKADQYGLRGGWARHTGKSCKAVCGCMFANTLGAAMSRDLRPYVSYRLPV